MQIQNIPLELIFDFWKGSKKQFQKCHFRQFLTIFEHLRSIFTDQEKAETVVKLIFFLFFDPPTKCACYDSKYFLDFEKKSKKIETSKKDHFKARNCCQMDFFLFFDPPNVPVLISKQFSDFEKVKKNLKRPLLHQESKKCLFKGRKSGKIKGGDRPKQNPLDQ